MTEDGLSESLQVMDFPGTFSISSVRLMVFTWVYSFLFLLIMLVTPGANCLLNSDGTDELPEEWLVNCSQDSEPRLPAEEMYAIQSISAWLY
jgi:hypothetical protein